MNNKEQKMLNPVIGEIADEELDKVVGGIEGDAIDTSDTRASEIVSEEDCDIAEQSFPVTVSVEKGTSVLNFEANLSNLGLCVSDELWRVLLESYIDSGSIFNCYVRIQFLNPVSGQVVVAR
ncbi:MAG: hypothetical protein LUG62_03350 [Clostridiales bacterium]|nr:hypothetical protein [Clostridiales bacterium]